MTLRQARDYDPAADAARSYDAALAAKKARGDHGYPEKWPADAVQRRLVSALVPYAHNARTHSAGQIDQIAASIREWGFTMPVLVDVSDTVIAGHGRLLAAQQLGLDTVPVMVAKGWTAKQIRAYRLADNQLALNAAWDVKLLAAELGELTDMADLMGFSDDELLRVLGGRQGLTDPDEAPPLPEEPVTRRGDLWTCGKHRLLCGDATSAEDVARLLGDVKPNLMVTDPPYGVNYDADWRNRADRANGKAYGARAIGEVSNDDRADWRTAWTLFPGAVAYVWHGALHNVEVAASLEIAGLKPRAQIVWVKTRPVISRGDYHWQHEPAFYAEREGFDIDHEEAAYFVRVGKTAGWTGSRKQSTVWFIEHIKSETGHSAQKPVECMRRPIVNNSNAGQAVYDPFVGSGTTMIAAEMEGRQAFCMDISEGYVDVAVRRWEAFTGETAARATA
jgi:DNA modification methylase